MIKDFNLAPQPPVLVAAAEGYASAALDASRGDWPGVAEHRDITFGPGAWQKFDLFTPEGATDTDVLIFFHGGGWATGYKEWCGFMAPALAARGVTLAAPTYRLVPEHRFPVFLQDALQAIAAVIARVADYGGKPRRIFLAGHSAGGHIAAMSALRTDLWSEYDIPADALKGCLPISGILDLHHPAPPPGSLEERVYLEVLQTPEDDRAASPVNWLHQLTLPMAAVWGQQDTERVQRGNTAMQNALTGGATPCRFTTYPEDHFGTHLMLRDPNHDWYDTFDDMRKGQL